MKKSDLYDLFISKGWFDKIIYDDASLRQRKKLWSLVRSSEEMLRVGLIDEEDYQSIKRNYYRKRKALYLHAMRSKIPFRERMKVIKSFRKRIADGTTVYQLNRTMPRYV